LSGQGDKESENKIGSFNQVLGFGNKIGKTLVLGEITVPKK